MSFETTAQYVNYSDVMSDMPDPHGTRRGVMGNLERDLEMFRLKHSGGVPGRVPAIAAGIAYCKGVQDALGTVLGGNSFLNCETTEVLFVKTFELCAAYCAEFEAWRDGFTVTSEPFEALTQRASLLFDELRLEDRQDIGDDVAVLDDLTAVVPQLHEMFRKSNYVPGGKSQDELAEMAWDKTLETEAANAQTNARLTSLWKRFALGHVTREGDMDELENVQLLEYITNFIGRHLRDPRFDRIADKATFGPGTTVATGKDIIDKISGNRGDPLNVSAGLLNYAYPILVRYYPGWAKHMAVGGFTDIGEAPVDGFLSFSCDSADEMFATVDKDWRARRPIGTQSTLNSLLQAGIGREWEDVCLRAGNPITQCVFRGQQVLDPQSFNQERALLASASGSDCTVDFSSASELICKILVRWVLDDMAFRGSEEWQARSAAQKWARIMDLTRSNTLEYDGRVILLERFSATGNGFTFPLMTMVILGLGRYACSKHGLDPRLARVFGDDLIVPNELFPEIQRLSTLLGFRVNREKSYFNGYFRESCGVNAVNGVDITPFRFSGTPQDGGGNVAHVVSMANGLYRASMRGSRGLYNRVGLSAARASVLEHLPKLVRRVLPAVGDPGDDTRIAGCTARECVKNPLGDLYWRGIGLTPCLVRTRKTKRVEEIVTDGDAHWTHKVYSSFIYNTRVSPRALRGSFVLTTEDDYHEQVMFRPGLPV